MRFIITQSVAVTPDAAVAAYTDPAFYADRPPWGDISLLEVVDHRDDGDSARLEVRYQFTGSVSSAVRAVVDPTKISWVTRTDIDKERRHIGFTVVPDHYPDRLSCAGAFSFVQDAIAPESTVVTIEGDLRVHVFLVGHSVEQLIVKGLRAYLAAEASTLPDFTARPEGPA